MPEKKNLSRQLKKGSVVSPLLKKKLCRAFTNIQFPSRNHTHFNHI